MPDTGAPGPNASLAQEFLQVWNEAPEAIVALDANWHYCYANASARTLLHLPEDVVGADSRKIHPEAGATLFAPAYREVMTTGIAQTVEHHYRPLDTYLRAVIRPWAHGIVIWLIDVTDQRRPQTRLQRDLDLYQQVLDATSQAVTIRDLDGRYLLVNQAAAERLGQSAERLVGQTAEAAFGPELGAVLRALDLAVLKSGEPQDVPAAHALHPERTVLPKVFPIRDLDGEIVAISTTVIDISDTVAAQADAAASQLRFRRVFASTSLGIIVARVDGRVLETNGAACRILGYSRSQLLSMDILDLVPPDRRAAAAGRRRIAVADDLGYEVEDDMLRSDGSRVPVLMTVNITEDPAGGGQILSAMIRDLTDVRVLEQQVVAAARMEAVGQLAATIAHDANNILAGVAGYVELLRPEVVDQPSATRYLAGITRSIARAGDMVERLLSFSRGDAAPLVPLDLADIVRDMSDLLERLLPPAVTLSTELRPAPVLADASQLRQVVLNLVVNARNALDGSGSILVTVGPRTPEGSPPLSALAVTDDGPGMTDEVARRCFDPFFTTGQASGGTGVGLTAAHRIAREHQGELRLRTAVGVGTTFELLLPAAPPQTAVLPPYDRTKGTVRVVVIDDDPAVRDVVVRTLANAGYSVAAYESAEAALESAFEADLVVTDVHMTGMSGVELATGLRKAQPRLPVLLMSGAADREHDAEWALLPKPFTDEALLTSVATALAGPR